MGGGGMQEEPPVDPDNTNVFVGNLPKDGAVSSQDLTEAFVSGGCKFADIVEVCTILVSVALRGTCWLHWWEVMSAHKSRRGAQCLYFSFTRFRRHA